MSTKSQMLLLKGAISELPEQSQVRVHQIAAKIREHIAESEEGIVAMALIGLELQLKAES